MAETERPHNVASSADASTKDWQAAFSRAYAPCSFRPTCERAPAPHRKSVPAYLHQHVLDDLGLVDLRCGPATVRRCRRDMSSTDPDSYALLIPRSGAVRLRTPSDSLVLSPGDVALWHFAQPATFSASHLRKLSLILPSAAIDQWRDLRCRTTVREQSVPAVRVLLGFLQALVADAASINRNTTTAVRNATVELVGAILRDSETSPDYVGPLGLAMLRWVDQHLPDGNVTPEAVATAHGVSVRTLHRAFAAMDQTFAGTVRDRRLERARQDLIKRTSSVTDIAHKWGFADGSHFARLFRERHGVSPREFLHESELSKSSRALLKSESET